MLDKNVVFFLLPYNESPLPKVLNQPGNVYSYLPLRLWDDFICLFSPRQIFPSHYLFSISPPSRDIHLVIPLPLITRLLRPFLNLLVLFHPVT